VATQVAWHLPYEHDSGSLQSLAREHASPVSLFFESPQPMASSATKSTQSTRPGRPTIVLMARQYLSKEKTPQCARVISRVI
jgi:hypothetical protein